MADKEYLQAASVETLVDNVEDCADQIAHGCYSGQPGKPVFEKLEKSKAELLRRFAALEAERDEATQLAIDASKVAEILIRHNTHPDGDKAVREFMRKWKGYLTNEATSHDSNE